MFNQFNIIIHYILIIVKAFLKKMFNYFNILLDNHKNMLYNVFNIMLKGATKLTIGNAIIEYRKKHGLSQREFSRQCGLSNGIISILEKGINPNTKEPIVPTLPTLNLLANGMGITVNSLIEMIEDLPIALINEVNCLQENDSSVFIQLTSEDQKELMQIYDNLNQEGQKRLLDYANDLSDMDKYKKCSDSQQDVG